MTRSPDLPVNGWRNCARAVALLGLACVALGADPILASADENDAPPPAPAPAAPAPTGPVTHTIVGRAKTAVSQLNQATAAHSGVPVTTAKPANATILICVLDFWL